MAPGDVSSVPTNRASPKSDARGRAVDAPSAKRRENARPKRGRASLDDARRTRDAREPVSVRRARSGVPSRASDEPKGNPPRIYFSRIQASTVFSPIRLVNRIDVAFLGFQPRTGFKKKRTETLTTTIEVWQSWLLAAAGSRDDEDERGGRDSSNHHHPSHRGLALRYIRLASCSALFASPPLITRPPPRCTALRPP